MVLLDEVCHHFFVSIKSMDGPRLILCHEAAITLHICTEDGGEFAFNFLCGHGIPQRLGGRLVLKKGVIRCKNY
jgi:hypothetical protein